MPSFLWTQSGIDPSWIVHPEKFKTHNSIVETQAKSAEEMKDAVNQAFQNLPDEIRSTLSLREYDGLSYEEIAKVQNCPIGTVRSRIFKGRELINETFSKLGLSKTWSN